MRKRERQWDLGQKKRRNFSSEIFFVRDQSKRRNWVLLSSPLFPLPLLFHSYQIRFEEITIYFFLFYIYYYIFIQISLLSFIPTSLTRDVRQIINFSLTRKKSKIVNMCSCHFFFSRSHLKF